MTKLISVSDLFIQNGTISYCFSPKSLGLFLNATVFQCLSLTVGVPEGVAVVRARASRLELDAKVLLGHHVERVYHHERCARQLVAAACTPGR